MRGKGCSCGRMNCPYCRGRRSCACHIEDKYFKLLHQ